MMDFDKKLQCTEFVSFFAQRRGSVVSTLIVGQDKKQEVVAVKEKAVHYDDVLPLISLSTGPISAIIDKKGVHNGHALRHICSSTFFHLL